MRISRVHTELPLATGQELVLGADASHYLSRVLRLRLDASIHLFNARDGEFLARVAAIEKKAVTVLLQERRREPAPPRLSIHLGLGLSRGDRMDFGIQKSTELGVTQITPLYSRFGEVKLSGDRADNKRRHWQQIAVNAAEQCGRLDVPQIYAPIPLQEWQDAVHDDTPCLMLDPSGADTLTGQPITSAVNVVIGPEGGFAAEELESARKAGFRIVALGSRVLRTETAPIATLAILQHLYGDM